MSKIFVLIGFYFQVINHLNSFSNECKFIVDIFLLLSLYNSIFRYFNCFFTTDPALSSVRQSDAIFVLTAGPIDITGQKMISRVLIVP